MPAYSDLAHQLDERAASLEKRRHRGYLEQTARIIRALDARDFPTEEVEVFTQEIRRAVDHSDWRAVRTVRDSLLKHLEKEHGLVVPGHYQNEWTGIGMVVFGLPIGAALANALDSSAYIGIGLPIGLAIGSGVGARKDQQARAEGRVLETDAEDAGS